LLINFFIILASMKSLHTKLVQVQSELKAPKNQRNKFGNYNYRSCEDILEAVKPILSKHELVLTISDKINNEPLYCEATASITDGENTISVTAQAGIDPNKKGMDVAQSFGASSSYARKYALNGLFLIDDTKDADATNKHGKTVTEKETLTPKHPNFNKVKQYLSNGGNPDMVHEKYNVSDAAMVKLVQS
tara:strand:+ start:286 stop:855 length:570 start_codon:yes stop_codon:yes gene_type:complete